MDNFADQLYQAVKNDDTKAFEACQKQTPCDNLRLGRFPVLSVMYLYNSKKLISLYERKYIKINSWQETYEPPQLAADFQRQAGRCLRLYLSEIVSPTEMLLILDRTARLKKVFALSHATGPVKQRLKDVYSIKYGLQVQFNGTQILLDKRPLTKGEKKQLAVACVCIFLCLAIVVSTPFVVNVFAPFIARNGEIYIKKLDNVNLAKNRVYSLQSDVTLPQDFFAEKVNCEIRGNGHTVTVRGSKSPFDTLNGKITDVVFQTSGVTVVQTVALGAKIEKVSVNVAVSEEISCDKGYVVQQNYGTVENVTVNVSGKVNIVAPQQQEKDFEGFNLGGIVGINSVTKGDRATTYGFITNCTANYTDFSLKGELNASATFGGICGSNDGVIDNCQCFGKVTADTLDVAGICCNNTYGVQNCKNSASLSQTSQDPEWSPLVAGIVCENTYVVQFCQNSGNLSSTGERAYCGGICARNYNRIVICQGGGNLTAQGEYCFVGGISAQSVAKVIDKIICFGYAVNCISNGSLSATANKAAVAGGIVGYVEQLLIHIVNPTTDEYVNYAGGAINCYFVGNCLQADYSGAVAGIFSKDVYGDTEKNICRDNLYSDNCGTSQAVGATVTVTKEGEFQFYEGGNVGGMPSTLQEITQQDNYLDILRYFN